MNREGPSLLNREMDKLRGIQVLVFIIVTIIVAVVLGLFLNHAYLKMRGCEHHITKGNGSPLAVFQLSLIAALVYLMVWISNRYIYSHRREKIVFGALLTIALLSSQKWVLIDIIFLALRNVASP